MNNLETVKPTIILVFGATGDLAKESFSLPFIIFTLMVVCLKSLRSLR
jgi:glucose-6-phosphate 1-dehydrogenase